MSTPERNPLWQSTGRSIVRASLRAFDASERTAKAGWASQVRRVGRWRAWLFMIVQISVAAGISWGFSRYVLGHEAPFLATVAAIICLGFSFGQRLGRVVEVAIGVTVGVFCGDLFVHFFGTGVWQIMLVIFVAMSIATWLGARTIMVTQAAVQAATVLTVYPGINAGLARWQDALVGCTVALLFATVAPTTPIDRPRMLAAKVLHGAAGTLRSIVAALRDTDAAAADGALEQARASEAELSALLTASNEGVSVVRTSPFLRRHRTAVLQVADLVVPLDRFIRNLRVMARRAAVAVYRDEAIPAAYLELIEELAQVTDECAAELFARRTPESQRPALGALGEKTSHLDLGAGLSTTVLLAQLRSMIVDLLELTGVPYTDARTSVPDME